MAERIVHYGIPRRPLTACGHVVYLFEHNRRTEDPDKVTCKGCLRSTTLGEVKQ